MNVLLIVVYSAARRSAAMVFDLKANFGKNQQRTTPKASDLFKIKSDGHSIPEPTQSVLDMDWSCQVWLCVTVTTDVPVIHKLAVTPGQFCHVRHFNNEDAKHNTIKQLSWAHGQFDEAKDPTKPWHKCRTWSTNSKDIDLRTFLIEMLDELKKVLQKSGSLCMYDIELEAGIIMEAMRALQLPSIYVLRWRGAATLGRPLLNLTLLRWVFGYHSKVDFVELHKLCEHVLGKTVSSNEPGLQCWMLFRKMHLKVHKHTTKAIKRIRGTGTEADAPLPGDGPTSMAYTNTELVRAAPKRFQLLRSPVQIKAARMVHKAAYLKLDHVRMPPPPAKTLSHFQRPCSMWLALDIKTHELIPNTAVYQGWVSGQFGHPCCFNEDQLQDLRIVQIGWSIGRFEACSSPLTKSLLVKPDGFIISKAAAVKHGVTTKKAAEFGSPIIRVLIRFLADLADLKHHCGRVCGHQLEFVMGVIKCEMERAGLDDELEALSQAATDGFCTMNPDIADWACAELVEHTRHRTSMGHHRAISVKDMVQALLPGQVALLKQHHEPGAHSRMAWVVLRELFRHVAQAAASE